MLLLVCSPLKILHLHWFHFHRVVFGMLRINGFKCSLLRDLMLDVFAAFHPFIHPPLGLLFRIYQLLLGSHSDVGMVALSFSIFKIIHRPVNSCPVSHLHPYCPLLIIWGLCVPLVAECVAKLSYRLCSQCMGCFASPWTGVAAILD